MKWCDGGMATKRFKSEIRVAIAIHVYVEFLLQSITSDLTNHNSCHMPCTPLESTYPYPIRCQTQIKSIIICHNDAKSNDFFLLFPIKKNYSNDVKVFIQRKAHSSHDYVFFNFHSGIFTVRRISKVALKTNLTLSNCVECWMLETSV